MTYWRDYLWWHRGALEVWAIVFIYAVVFFGAEFLFRTIWRPHYPFWLVARWLWAFAGGIYFIVEHQINLKRTRQRAACSKCRRRAQ